MSRAWYWIVNLDAWNWATLSIIVMLSSRAQTAYLQGIPEPPSGSTKISTFDVPPSLKPTVRIPFRRIVLELAEVQHLPQSTDSQ